MAITSGRSAGPPRTSIIEEAGRKLKRIREQLGLKYRDVGEASARIAAARQNDEFLISLSRLADIENKGTLPSIYKLYSLCAVYRVEMAEVLSWYGISLSLLAADAGLIQNPRTHMVRLQPHGEAEVQVPVALEPGVNLNKTVFLSRIVQQWGKLPLMLLGHTDVRNRVYGLIGSNDWSMFPIISPGSLVVIDDSRRRIAASGWKSEFDRPIYFIEHRAGYSCGWCYTKKDRLTVQPHPSSPCEPESYAYPGDAEVIGQVTQVAMTLDPVQRRRPRR